MHPSPSGRFLLIYGSVTGKAESIAELIVEEAKKRGFEPELQCMKDVGKKVIGDFFVLTNFDQSFFTV